MKKLLTILVLGLFLITPSHADDIRDFQIEGMSIEDSALDYFTKEELDKIEKEYYPKSKKFYRIFKSANSDPYDRVAFHLKSNDPSYIIYALTGIEWLEYTSCKIKQKTIVAEFKTIFGNKMKIKEYEQKHPIDTYGESLYYSIDFFFNDGSQSRIICIDYGNKFSEESGFEDNLTIALTTKKFTVWLNTKAYK